MAYNVKSILYKKKKKKKLICKFCFVLNPLERREFGRSIKPKYRSRPKVEPDAM